MWKCKSCGGEIVADICAITNECEVAQDKSVKVTSRDVATERYYCIDCDEYVVFADDLDSIAHWEE